jgi:hypothetical protein
MDSIEIVCIGNFIRMTRGPFVMKIYPQAEVGYFDVFTHNTNSLSGFHLNVTRKLTAAQTVDYVVTMWSMLIHSD